MMDARKVSDGAITATAGVAVVLVDEVLKDLDLPLWRLPTAPLVALAAFFGLYKLQDVLVRNSKSIRGLFIPLTRFEGRWIDYWEQAGGQRCGVFDLTYDDENNVHFVNGKSYLDGKFVAGWNSWPVTFTARTKKLEYKFSGETKSRRALKISDETHKVDGWTSIDFSDPDRNGGHGYFVDFHPTPTRHDFEFERLTDEVAARERSKYSEDSHILTEFRPHAG